MRSKEAIQKVLEVLNDGFKCDPENMTRMVKASRPTTQQMLNHPEIICGGTEPFPTIAMLGIINGITRKLYGDKARIAVSYDENGQLLGFIEHVEKWA